MFERKSHTKARLFQLVVRASEAEQTCVGSAPTKNQPRSFQVEPSGTTYITVPGLDFLYRTSAIYTTQSDADTTKATTMFLLLGTPPKVLTERLDAILTASFVKNAIGTCALIGTDATTHFAQLLLSN